MEAGEQEWTKAAEAAEYGLGYQSKSARLRFHAGYARSELGWDLLREFQARAADEFLKARSHLHETIQILREVENQKSNRFRLRGRAFLTLALTLEALGDLFGG